MWNTGMDEELEQSLQYSSHTAIFLSRELLRPLGQTVCLVYTRL